jgi:hypothetical protein
MSHLILHIAGREENPFAFLPRGFFPFPHLQYAKAESIPWGTEKEWGEGEREREERGFQQLPFA